MKLEKAQWLATGGGDGRHGPSTVRPAPAHSPPGTRTMLGCAVPRPLPAHAPQGFFAVEDRAADLGQHLLLVHHEVLRPTAHRTPSSTQIGDDAAAKPASASANDAGIVHDSCPAIRTSTVAVRGCWPVHSLLWVRVGTIFVPEAVVLPMVVDIGARIGWLDGRAGYWGRERSPMRRSSG